MKRPGSLGKKLAAAYAVICVVAAAYAAIRFIWSPAQSEMAGIAFVLLGLPWTLAVPVMMGVLGSSAWLALGGIAAACVLNLWLLSRIGSR